MNEPLNAATIERCRDCTAPCVPAVEEMADSHELLRSMLAERDREIAEAKKILAEELTKNSALRSKLDFLKLCEKMAAEYLAEAKTFRARWEAAENRGETERIRADENYVNFCSVRRQLEELRADRDRLDKLADQYGSDLATAELKLAEARARVVWLEALLTGAKLHLEWCARKVCGSDCRNRYGDVRVRCAKCIADDALAALSADPLKVGKAVMELNAAIETYDKACFGGASEVFKLACEVAIFQKARALSAVMKGEG